MTNKIMSIAAAAAILGTGAYAFDTNPAGTIQNRDLELGKYVDGTKAELRLLKSADGRTMPSGVVTDRLKGDALIFPRFRADSKGWETEIVFRNNYNDKAVIAKVVMYDAKDSSEVRDFNVYLSAKDQVRFKLSLNGIDSTDGSIVTKEPIWDANGDPSNSMLRVKFASDAPGEAFHQELNDIVAGAHVSHGYVVVYAMAETNGTNNGYHKRHAEIWKAYREAIDATRPEWRTYNNTIQKGVYTGGLTTTPGYDPAFTIASPNVEANLTTLNSPGPLALSGTVRIYNAIDSNGARDVLLPATALQNFTEDNKTNGVGTLMLWAPSEYAAIADRCIDSGSYDKGCIGDDTETFLVSNATYTFQNADTAVSKTVANQLIFTQPTKRTMAQLKLDTYWNVGGGCETDSGLITGLALGIRGDFRIFNDDEKTFGVRAGVPIDDSLTSPGDQDPDEPGAIEGICDELAVIENVENVKDDPADDVYPQWPRSSNGHLTYVFSAENNVTMIPAIVTQMSASVVGGEGKINWVYAPTDKPNN